MPRKNRTYNLYTKCDPGKEPQITVAVDEPKGDTKHVKVPKYGYRRGALIFTSHTYKELTTHTENLAHLIGMPKSRIWDLFDWNEG